MGVFLDGGDQGVAHCAFVSRVASNIGLGSGDLQVSPNLEGLGNCDGHSFIGDSRIFPVVWLQRPIIEGM